MVEVFGGAIFDCIPKQESVDDESARWRRRVAERAFEG
jgi:hypothetical protein